MPTKYGFQSKEEREAHENALRKQQHQREEERKILEINAAHEKETRKKVWESYYPKVCDLVYDILSDYSTSAGLGIKKIPSEVGCNIVIGEYERERLLFLNLPNKLKWEFYVGLRREESTIEYNEFCGGRDYRRNIVPVLKLELEKLKNLEPDISVILQDCTSPEPPIYSGFP